MTKGSLAIADRLAGSLHEAARRCLAQIEHHADGAKTFEDPEALHELRVAIRRLRATAAFARKAGLPTLSAQARSDLRCLWQVLGPARDWDVFVDTTWPAARARVAAPTEHRKLDAAAAKLQAASRVQVRRALDGQRFHRIIRALRAANIGRSGPHEPPRLQRRKDVARLLARQAKKLSRCAKRFEDLDAGELHALRIRAKKLRYRCELLGALYPVKASRRYIKRLAAVQAALGSLNDLAVGARLVRLAAARANGSAGNAAADRWNEYAAVPEAQLRRQLAKSWRKFDTTPPFWR